MLVGQSQSVRVGWKIAGFACAAMLATATLVVAGPSSAAERLTPRPQRALPSVHLPAVEADRVKALIVQYRPGYRPRSTGPLLGTSAVTGPVRRQLTLGLALGQHMWRVDFATPVSQATAARVARQLATHRAIAFAEIDRPVGVAGQVA